jgi:DNA invertase Pin-like site-specific DNA recombinase
MPRRTPVGYVRVSTSKQGKSGLGIEAQREALQWVAAAEGFDLGRVFVEIGLETCRPRRTSARGTPTRPCCPGPELRHP